MEEDGGWRKAVLSRPGFPEGKSLPQIQFIQDCQKQGESWRQESQVLLSSGGQGEPRVGSCRWSHHNGGAGDKSGQNTRGRLKTLERAGLK